MEDPITNEEEHSETEAPKETESSELEKKPEPTPEVKNKKKSNEPKKAKKKKKKRKNVGIAAILAVLLLALLGCGGFLFFQEYYLQTIEAIRVEGVRDEMTVILDTEIENSLLTVTITDANGNTYTHVIAATLEKNEKYVVYTDEWVLDTPITGDFTIEIVNNSPTQQTGNKDRFTILDISWN